MAASPKYSLHYFNLASRGEIIRTTFYHAGVDFEDKRLEMSEHPAMKANETLYPLGQLPVLLIDGEVYCQSLAIVRYLAREFNLYGKTNKESFIIDQTLDTLINIEEKLWGAYFWKKTVEEKKQQINDLFTTYAPRGFRMIENFLKQNNNGEDFIVGKEITIADIHLMVTIETIELDHNLPEYRSFLDSYPLLKELNNRVRSAENIKKYLEKRGPPFYPFPNKE